MKNTLTKAAQVALVAGSFLGFALTASAWTGPVSGTVAPANNAAAPINVTNKGQEKLGSLTVHGFLDQGSAFITGHTEIGADPCYTDSSKPCTITGPSGSLLQHFALATPKSVVAEFFNSFEANRAQAATIGTPSGDILHVYGNATFSGGEVLIKGKKPCLADGTDCGSGTAALWKASSTNQYSTNTGNVGIGQPAPGDKLSVNGATPGALFSIQSGGSTKWMLGLSDVYGTAFQIGAGGTMPGTPEVSILKGSGYVGLGVNTPRTKLEVNGTVTANGSVVALASVTANKESHFADGSYSDPRPGVAEGLKATSIATSRLFVGGDDGTPAVLVSDGSGAAYWTPKVPVYVVNGACFVPDDSGLKGLLSVDDNCNNKYGTNYKNNLRGSPSGYIIAPKAPPVVTPTPPGFSISVPWTNSIDYVTGHSGAVQFEVSASIGGGGTFDPSRSYFTVTDNKGGRYSTTVSYNPTAHIMYAWVSPAACGTDHMFTVYATATTTGTGGGTGTSYAPATLWSNPC